MTTIAYKNGILAADTQITEYSRFSGHISKIGRIGSPLSGIVWGACGCLHLFNSARDWIDSGLKGDFSPAEASKGSLVFILMHEPSSKKIRKLEFSEGKWDVSYIDPEIGFATGSGAELALGAMLHGASATEAVKIAMKIDNATGGEVDYLDINPDDFFKIPNGYLSNEAPSLTSYIEEIKTKSGTVLATIGDGPVFELSANIVEGSTSSSLRFYAKDPKIAQGPRSW